MATHYEVLGVAPDATATEVRRAYYARARALHPDRVGNGGSARAMQDVNEAWRVLRDPSQRARYDARLASPTGSSSAAAGNGTTDRSDFDRPFHDREVAPVGLLPALLRSLPWLAVLFVLALIFVFTAFAADSGDTDGRQFRPLQLLGRCVQVQPGVGVVPVGCDEPNEGRVVAVGTRASQCGSASARPVDGDGPWLCLQPADATGGPGSPPSTVAEELRG